jgi:GntR family transcriptional regulator/MocR family aminotransferase
VYRGRRDAFASLLRAHFGELIRFNVPLGGLAFWIQFLCNEHLQQLETRACAKGFRMLLSDSYRICDSAPFGLRLGFASKDHHEMSEAITRLRGFLEEPRLRLGAVD